MVIRFFQNEESDMKSGFAKFSDDGATLSTWRSMLRMARRTTPFQWLQVMLMCAAVIGCAGLKTSYVGTPARPDNRHPLATTDGGPAVWQAKDMALYYQTTVSNEALEIKGTVERLNTIKHFSVVNYFRVSIHFLDNEGIILGSHLLWAAGNRVEEKLVRWTFEKEFSLPDGATAIGFSYRGGFADDGDSDSGPGHTGWQVLAQP
jgi:hypothetical protein